MRISLPEEELNAIARAIEPEGFNLVFIKYNRHKAIVDNVIEFISNKYPNRKSNYYKEGGEFASSYDGFFKRYEKLNQGIFFFDGFENVLSSSKVYPSLNIQRDYLAKFNISLICFVGLNDAIAECQRKIPDLFSYRAHTSEFSWIDTRADFFKDLLLFSDFRFSSKNGKSLSAKLKFAHTRIAQFQGIAQEMPIDLKIVLPREISVILTDCMLYEEALIWRKKIDSYSLISNKQILKPSFEFNKCRIAYLYTKLNHLDLALEILKKSESNSNTNLGIEYYYTCAYLYFSKGNYDASLSNIIEGKSISSIDISYTVDFYFLESFIYLKRGNFLMAIEAAKYLMDNDKNISIDDCFATNLLIFEGYRCQGDFENAQSFYENAADVIRNLRNHPYTALRHEAYAFLIASMGERTDEALRHIGYGIKIAKRVFDPEHPFIAKFYYSRARIYYLMGEIDKSLYSLRRARKIFEGYYGNEHSSYKQVTEVIDRVLKNANQKDS